MRVSSIQFRPSHTACTKLTAVYPYCPGTCADHVADPVSRLDPIRVINAPQLTAEQSQQHGHARELHQGLSASGSRSGRRPGGKEQQRHWGGRCGPWRLVTVHERRSQAITRMARPLGKLLSRRVGSTRTVGRLPTGNVRDLVKA